jgi:outer membrane protein OmpA-like peptidoglycan-associated protein
MLHISDVRVTWLGDSLQVGFTLNVNPKAVKRGHALLLTPVIADADHSVALEPLLVQHDRIAPRTAYQHTVAYGAWMQGSDLKLKAMSYDCCEVTDYPVGFIARGLLTPKPAETPAPAAKDTTAQTPAPTPVVAVQHAAPPAAAQPPRSDIPAYAVAVKSDYIPTTETEIRTAARGMRATSLNIQFRQGETTFDEGYRDNRAALSELVNVLKQLESSADRRISYILIDGHVSPEGGSFVNMPIGLQRALAVKRYLEQQTGLPPSRIVAHNGYIDWEYLKQMVRASSMYEKQQVLNILETVPEWDARRQVGRLGEIMRLHSGSTYRYMLREFFPKMRNATYIKVFYQDKR